MKPRWINRTGYTDYPFDPPRFERGLLWRTTELVEFTLADNDPATLVDEFNVRWLPDKHFASDGGSIPPMVAAITGISREKYRPAFYWHDSSYRHGGLWMESVSGRTFIRLTRRQADSILSQALSASGATQWEINVVDIGLSVGGRWAWNRHAERRKAESDKRQS